MTTPPRDTEPERLYIAVRADLAPGDQLCQAVHAISHFQRDHRNLFDPWITQSNYLVVVAVPDENSLLDLIKKAKTRGLSVTAVREPDLHDEATAAVFEPGKLTQKLCANLPCALKPPKEPHALTA